MNQKPTQLVRYPNVTLTSMPRFEKDLDLAFKRKNIPIWITEYGNETRPGEPKGVTEGQQAVVHPAGACDGPQGHACPDVHLVRDAGLGGQPLAERHLSRRRVGEARDVAFREGGESR